MNGFDVRIYTVRRRKDRRRPYEVRWQAAGRARSKSFNSRALADSYRAELVGFQNSATGLNWSSMRLARTR